MGQHADRWMHTLRREPNATIRLVCFHHAGGSATSFAALAKTMPSPIDVLAIQAPGRQERHMESCLDSVAELAQGALPAVQEAADHRVALLGHSLGACVAFEVAQSLERIGIQPLRLFVSSRPAPSVHRTDYIHRWPDSEIKKELAALGGPGMQVLEDPEMAALLMPVIRADYRAGETYFRDTSARVGCPITAVGGDRDPWVPVDQLRRWRDHTKSQFKISVLGGGHFYVVDKADKVARLIGRELLSDSSVV
jgi:surfactin synthase thioesterase subunit